MIINFTESDIEEMLAVVRGLQTIESSDFKKQEEVFTWTINGQEVTITVGEDEI